MTSYKEIEAEALLDLIAKNKVILVDVRDSDDLARGVIANAIHIPLSYLPVQHESLPARDPIVFYCHSGIRSAQAAAFVANKGHEEVYNLIGGTIAWGQAGLKFEDHKI